MGSGGVRPITFLCRTQFPSSGFYNEPSDCGWTTSQVSAKIRLWERVGIDMYEASLDWLGFTHLVRQITGEHGIWKYSYIVSASTEMSLCINKLLYMKSCKAGPQNCEQVEEQETKK